EILLDDQHRGALLAGRDSRDETARAGANDDDVDLTVPSDIGRLRQRGGHRSDRRSANHRTRGQEAAPGYRSPDASFGVVLVVLKMLCCGRFRQWSPPLSGANHRPEASLAD